MAKRQATAKRTTKKAEEPKRKIEIIPGRISLGELLSKSPDASVQEFGFWIVGDSPLICHAWSQKAKLEMLEAQTGATRAAKPKRDPDQDFADSLYEMEPGSGVYGFPITAVKKAILSCAHKDRGVPRSDVQSSLWLDAEIVSTRPALAAARCDMPLVRIFGPPPEMREDMVRIGAGLRRTANLAYRAQIYPWAMRITGSVNPEVVPAHVVAFLVSQSGKGVGIGDWRNEKGGWFGSYHIIKDQAELKAWEKFAKGEGKCPSPKRPLHEFIEREAAE